MRKNFYINLLMSVSTFVGLAHGSTSLEILQSFNQKMAEARIQQVDEKVLQTSKAAAQYLSGKSHGIQLARVATDNEREEIQKVVLQRVIAGQDKKEGKFSLKGTRHSDPRYTGHLAALAISYVAAIELVKHKAGFYYTMDDLASLILKNKLTSFAALKIKHEPLRKVIAETISKYSAPTIQKILGRNYLTNYRELSRDYPDVPHQWVIQMRDIDQNCLQAGNVALATHQAGTSVYTNSQGQQIAACFENIENQAALAQYSSYFTYGQRHFLNYRDYAQNLSRIDNLGQLPDEIILRIASFLKKKDLSQFGKASKRMLRISRDPSLVISTEDAVVKEQILNAPHLEDLLIKSYNTPQGDIKLVKGMSSFIKDKGYMSKLMKHPQGMAKLADYLNKVEFGNIQKVLKLIKDHKLEIDKADPISRYNMGLFNICTEQFASALNDLLYAEDKKVLGAKSALATLYFLTNKSDAAKIKLQEASLEEPQKAKQLLKFINIAQEYDERLGADAVLRIYNTEYLMENSLKATKAYFYMQPDMLTLTPQHYFMSFSEIIRLFFSRLGGENMSYRNALSDALRGLSIYYGAAVLQARTDEDFQERMGILSLLAEGEEEAAQCIVGNLHYDFNELGLAKKWATLSVQGGNSISAVNLLSIAQRFKKQGNIQEEEACLRTVEKFIDIDLHSNIPPVSAFSSAKDRYERALASLLPRVTKVEDVAASHTLSKLYFELGYYFKAKEWLVKCVKLGYQPALLYFYTYAMELLHQNNHLYEEFLRSGISYDSPECLEYYSLKLAREGRTNELYATLTRALRDKENPPVAHLATVGAEFKKRGDDKNANKFWLLGANHGHFGCIYSLAVSLAETGQLDDLNKSYKIVYNLNKSGVTQAGEFMNKVSQLLINRGHVSLGLQWLSGTMEIRSPFERPQFETYWAEIEGVLKTLEY
jgi:hypothetical protein